VSLFDLAEARRKKQEGRDLEGRDIKVQPDGHVILLPRRNGGNGSDD
jgi:hypothetical protein